MLKHKQMLGNIACIVAFAKQVEPRFRNSLLNTHCTTACKNATTTIQAILRYVYM